MKLLSLPFFPGARTGGALQKHEIPGTLWQQDDALINPIKSLDTTGYGRRVCFRNRSDQTVLLCWVDTAGNPHHFYALEPCQRSLRGRASAIIDATDHTEKTREGHAFLLACADDIPLVQREKSLEHATIIGGYRPEDLPALKDANIDNDSTVHLVEVFNNNDGSTPKPSFFERFVCCWPSAAANTVVSDNPFLLQVRLALLDKTPIDTTQKHYISMHLGQVQWPVQLEPNSLSDEQLELLAQDIDAMASRLPPNAVAALRESTPIWINKSLQYGPQTCPINGDGMCFHPGADWLKRNGMNPAKCECVEMYSTASYWASRRLWGAGGLLLHEFSHAYHHKCCNKGYDNKEIRQCYQAAIDSGLYDCVQVKKIFGEATQCETARAYACTDPMEYFAELSTAFLGQTTTSEEYNKWFPFNRQQIKDHDPRAYELLQKMWKVSDQLEETKSIS